MRGEGGAFEYLFQTDYSLNLRTWQPVTTVQAAVLVWIIQVFNITNQTIFRVERIVKRPTDWGILFVLLSVVRLLHGPERQD